MCSPSIYAIQIRIRIYGIYLPSWELTYPTYGKGQSSSQLRLNGIHVSSLEGTVYLGDFMIQVNDSLSFPNDAHNTKVDTTWLPNQTLFRRVPKVYFVEGMFSNMCTPPKFNIAPEQMMVGRLRSFLGRPILRGELLNFQRVLLGFFSSLTYLCGRPQKVPLKVAISFCWESFAIASMSGIFTHIWLVLMVKYGKCRQIHHTWMVRVWATRKKTITIPSDHTIPVLWIYWLVHGNCQTG